MSSQHLREPGTEAVREILKGKMKIQNQASDKRIQGDIRKEKQQSWKEKRQ